MAYLLRQIKYNRWLFDDENEWIVRGKTPADIAPDLATDKNRLSLWFVEETKSNLNRVILALAGNRSNLQHFEFVWFDEAILEQCGIPHMQTPGDVLDPEVVRQHIDINVNDIDGLSQLVKAIWLTPNRELSRIMTNELVSLSYMAFHLGTFKREYCSPKVFEELQKKWAQLPKGE